MFWRKQIPKIILSNIIVLVIGLLMLEIIFGNWFSPHQLNRLHLMRDVSRSYDLNGLYPTENNIIIYKRDKYGLRGVYTSTKSIDILTVGGSTADQRYITEGQTWQDILAKEFLAKGKSVSVVNAGVDGQSTYGHLKNFDWWFPSIPNLKTKYVLFYVGLNDFYKDDGNEYDDLVGTSSSGTTIKEFSALYYLYRTIEGMYEANLVANIGHSTIDFSDIEWKVSKPNIQNHEELMRDRLLSYRDRLKLLNKKVRELGAIPIYVTQPSRNYKLVNGNIMGRSDFLFEYEGVDINAVDYFYMMQLLNETTLEACEEVGGIPIDLANGVEWEDADFYDFSHNSPPGAEKIGRYLYEKLQHLF
jgi:hypothetical protein